ncbi:hypothetical protein [Nonomuraea sp. NPDC049784]|uniref:hypothetical protein n=1 Tax=Nonomuraea sp. NPDC049784 TaxID=3154361 RepID=UPI0033EB268C
MVWLNETQHYLRTVDDAGECVAAGLRTILTDSTRAPVLVLGTLWPAHWDTLTSSTSRFEQARAVLSGVDIAVPTAFDDEHMVVLNACAEQDQRLAEAVANADAGHVTQYLAGVPELMARYRHAAPTARALIHAAMDARRFGHRRALSHTLLKAAASAYLSDTEWDALNEDWFDVALSYAGRPCKGVPGPLTRIRPRVLGPSPQAADQAVSSEPRYRLADYLEQHGRFSRTHQMPPNGFWTALADHAHPGDLNALGNAAYDRGLYRDAAQHWKKGATHGSPGAARNLIGLLLELHPADRRPVRWAADHLAGSDAYSVSCLLGVLHEEQAHEEVIGLADRAATDFVLHEASAVAELLKGLQAVGAREQIDSLLARDPAGQVGLDDGAEGMVKLLNALLRVESDQIFALQFNRPDHASAVAELRQSLLARKQINTLLARNPSSCPPLQEASAVANMLRVLLAAGAQDQIGALLARDPASHVHLSDASGVARLLTQLQQVQTPGPWGEFHSLPGFISWSNRPPVDPTDNQAIAQDQIQELLARDPATHTSLDSLSSLSELLAALRAVGAQEQYRALTERAVTHLALDIVGAATLGSLQASGAHDLAAGLTERAMAQIPLGDTRAVMRLLVALRAHRAQDQISALLARDPATHVSLHDGTDTAILLEELMEIGAQDQVRMLLARKPAAHVQLHDAYGVNRLLESLQEFQEHDQVNALLARAPAAHVSLHDTQAVSLLLRSLKALGAQVQVKALARRAATSLPLDNARNVAALLEGLRRVRAGDEIAALLARDPASHTRLDDPADAKRLIEQLMEITKPEEQTTSYAADGFITIEQQAIELLDPDGKEELKNQLVRLTARLPAVGLFWLYQRYSGDSYWFGREPNGDPAPAWDWGDVYDR